MSEQTMRDRAIEVLRLTDDGGKLTAQDMALVERVINANDHEMDERQEAAFADLHAAVTAGRYVPALHGIEHLTTDHQGYVYWKGRNVEHFSFKDKLAEKQASLELAQRCQMLEAKGFPVTARSVLDRKFREAPADTQWLKLLLNVYSVSCRAGAVHWIILAAPEDNAIAMSRATGVLQVRRFSALPESESSGCFIAYHALQGEGYESASAFTSSYTTLIAAVEAAGFTPDDINQVLT